MNASTRAARRTVKARRAAGTKRTLATYVTRTAAASTTVKAVAAALRDKAKVLRAKGVLGRVQTRIERVAANRVGPVYRYTRRQLALVLAAYKPRKAEYVAVKTALLASI